MPVWLIWIIIGLLFLILEMMTPEFIVGSFAIGSFMAAVASIFSPLLSVQLLVFALVTLVFLWKIRPFFLRYMDNQQAKTNIDLLIGAKAKVIQAIGPEDERGRVKVGGEDWMAISSTGNYIEDGSRVEVVKVEGSKLIVREI